MGAGGGISGAGGGIALGGTAAIGVCPLRGYPGGREGPATGGGVGALGGDIGTTPGRNGGPSTDDSE